MIALSKDPQEKALEALLSANTDKTTITTRNSSDIQTTKNKYEL